MICGTYTQAGLDQATADLVAQSYKATTPVPLSVTTTQATADDGTTTWTVQAVYSPCPSNVAHSTLNLSWLSNSQQPIATQIAAAFATAGYGTPHQAAAIANAIAESSLDPNAISPPPEHSVGLFQLNTNGGLGAGYTDAELMDPAKNIDIIVTFCKTNVPDFANATDVSTATLVFVEQVERPASPAAAVAKRLPIAQRLIS